MHVKFPLANCPQWVGICLLALAVGMVLALAVVGVTGFRQGQRQAISEQSETLVAMRDQLEALLLDGDLSGAIRLGEHLESQGVLEEAEIRNVDRLRELRAAQAVNEGESPPVAEPIQHDHELWQAALAAHSRSEWPLVIEDLRRLKEVDRKFLTLPYIELMEDAYVQWARSLVTGHDGERSITLLRTAYALRNNERVQRELEVVNQIIDSLSTWGVDWPSTLNSLSDVYLYDPSYPGLQQLLRQAFELYAEGAKFRGSTCEAFLFLSGEQMNSLLQEFQKEYVRSQLKAACEAATQ